MDPFTEIPKDRKPSRPVRLAILLGMTVLLFLLILNHSGEMAAVLAVQTDGRSG